MTNKKVEIGSYYLVTNVNSPILDDNIIVRIVAVSDTIKDELSGKEDYTIYWETIINPNKLDINKRQVFKMESDDFHFDKCFIKLTKNQAKVMQIACTVIVKLLRIIS